MSRFSPSFLASIRERIPLSEIIAPYVKLTSKGSEHEGLCPFHKEKSPSFTINNTKEFYHCFGCGKHGDHFEFLMAHSHYSFNESVEFLARKAGVSLPIQSAESQAQESHKTKLMDICQAACQWYKQQLTGAPLAYLTEKRRLSAQTIQHFQLGYAPGKSALRQHLNQQGYADALLLEAGILGRSHDDRSDLYERLRNRIVFPIFTPQGRVVGFGGRLLTDGHPKYLNSPQTPLFHKGQLLYGYNFARPHVKTDTPILGVEGYLDVIALYQNGFKTAVASLGTALTDDHLKSMWRLCQEPILCFDGDRAGLEAGQKVAKKALPLLEPGKSVYFAHLPNGEDPDSLATHNPQAFKQLIANPKSLFDTLVKAEHDRKPLTTPERFADLKSRLKELAKTIENSDIRSAFFDKYYKPLRWSGQTRKPAFTHNSVPGLTNNPPLKAPCLPLDIKLCLAAFLFMPDVRKQGIESLSLIILKDKQYEAFRQDFLSFYMDTLDNSKNSIEFLEEKGYTSEIKTLTSCWRQFSSLFFPQEDTAADNVLHILEDKQQAQFIERSRKKTISQDNWAQWQKLVLNQNT
jgi:DNA primase